MGLTVEPLEALPDIRQTDAGRAAPRALAGLEPSPGVGDLEEQPLTGDADGDAKPDLLDRRALPELDPVLDQLGFQVMSFWVDKM